MPKKKPTKRVPWSPADLKLLKQLAGRQAPKVIARKLKRTEAAVRFKAHMSSVSLAMK